MDAPKESFASQPLAALTPACNFPAALPLTTSWHRGAIMSDLVRGLARPVCFYFVGMGEVSACARFVRPIMGDAHHHYGTLRCRATADERFPRLRGSVVRLQGMLGASCRPFHLSLLLGFISRSPTA